MLKKIIILILLSFSFFNNVSADNGVDPKIKSFYSKFTKIVNKKYSSNKKNEYLINVKTLIKQALEKRKFSFSKKILLEDFIKLLNEDIFNYKLSLNNSLNKKIIDSVNYSKYFENIVLNKDSIFLEDGIWYFYKYSNYKIFPKGTNIDLRDLKYNNVDLKNDLISIVDNQNVGIITDFIKVKLISDKIIYGIENKYEFLKEIKDDKKNLIGSTDSYFLKLKYETLKLTKGLKKEEKIKTIYNYILDNIEYTKSFKMTDSEVFSGIHTYKNKNGVCEGYAKLFSYMLSFAGINDINVIRGYVIDAQDFPLVGHAWIKIGNFYYDPTFDDPVGGNKTLKFHEYKYYKLPKDLFYTNRYIYSELPEILKTTSLDNRKNIINSNIAKLVNKYINTDYLLLKPFKLKQKYGIGINDNFTVFNVSKFIKSGDCKNFKFNNKIIASLKYYNIDNINNINNLIEQINYKFDGYYLMKWYLDDTNYKYRLAYDVKFR